MCIGHKHRTYNHRANKCCEFLCAKRQSSLNGKCTDKFQIYLKEKYKIKMPNKCQLDFKKNTIKTAMDK